MVNWINNHEASVDAIVPFSEEDIPEFFKKIDEATEDQEKETDESFAQDAENIGGRAA